MVQELAIYRQRPIKFSHVTHVVEEGWKCKDCHRGSLTEDEAGMPPPQSCRKCHETQEDIDKYLNPFAPEKKLMWTKVTRIHDDIPFSHKSHYKKEVVCEDCHKDILKSEEVSLVLRVEKDECLDCHFKKKVSGQCEHCHQSINEDWEPSSHEQNWKRFHGQVFRAGLDPPYTNRCSLCHADATCVSCHQDEEPRDHTSHWRHRGHGMAAAMDRDRCATCHLSYSCDACHQDTAPRSHTGSWGDMRNRHCLTCHFPLPSQGCNVCHQADTSHLLAAPMPYDQTHAFATGYGCRTCHIELGTLRHFEKGDNCRLCHR